MNGALPTDSNFKGLTSAPSAPVGLAIAVTYDATISSSTAVSLNASTTSIEVTAIDKGIFMKWGGTASSTSFDEFIGAGLTRCYEVPEGQTSVEFIQESATAKLVVIEK